ncbi:hypothetical protein XO10_01850 [Marinitoga sp. 1135]|uniref:Uncharacterized protein n=1 Tax=Marinitoga piezophila (strain DSM 14283 / JCM 11233 / KA3) TaxID=443254 RepID=H2J4F1_MARPK|nr:MULTISPECIES: hypothetical protein [Marinitoga]AEX84806.1 hypothetical protein Marpi_0358 [Marinitoga piezophila KA3]APT75317.1 hypothetical protein LN42_02120 [Marinitoga sp. 1137]NUU95050.1 hypothetical protein [Marinitoga sp. 1135]NUU97004.1 hypothetical protein [Marinitoga sp. 1138]
MKFTRILLYIAILLSIISITLSISNEFRYAKFKNYMESMFNRQNAKVTDSLSQMNLKLSELEKYFAPNGVVEKFINYKTNLEKHLSDLEKLLTLAQEDQNVGYFQIYITGSREVWIGIKNKNSKYIFQGMLKPGLNPYKFYFFKDPSVKTSYTIDIPYDAKIQTANPDNVYFLIQEPGQRRLKKMPSSKLDNISEDLNLYIPTIRGK